MVRYSGVAPFLDVVCVSGRLVGSDRAGKGEHPLATWLDGRLLPWRDRHLSDILEQRRIWATNTRAGVMHTVLATTKAYSYTAQVYGGRRDLRY